MNLKMNQKLKSHINKSVNEDHPKILIWEPVVCILHTVLIKQFHWLEDTGVLQPLFYLFKDIPLRQSDHTYHSGSSLFSHKFCSMHLAESRDIQPSVH